jgi:hypothetical protein
MPASLLITSDIAKLLGTLQYKQSKTPFTPGSGREEATTGKPWKLSILSKGGYEVPVQVLRTRCGLFIISVAPITKLNRRA